MTYFSLYSCRVQVERSILLAWQGAFTIALHLYIERLQSSPARRFDFSRKVHFDRRGDRPH